MSEYIPPDLQAEILKRLPLKPLIQFRSVSKTWKCLIDSPDFVLSYGVHYPLPHRFILRYEDVVDKYLTYVDNDDHTFSKQDFAPAVPDLIKCLEESYNSRVVGSSHGLLCLYGNHRQRPTNDDIAVLWNPSIRRSIGIRVPRMDDWPTRFVAHFGGVCTVVGFGVCPVTSAPTIVKISYVDMPWKINDSIPWQVQVFTLSSGAWNILSTNLPRESIRLRGPQVVINRFIYWVAFDSIATEDGGFQRPLMLISFDLSTKEFRVINLPDRLALDHLTLSISNLRESLVVLECTTDVGEEEPVWSLWMMTMMDQSVTTTFTRLYTINLPNSSVNNLLGFRKTGEPIMETQSQYDIYATLDVYEPCSQKIHNLGIDGEDGSFFMCSYMETLLLLDQPEGYICSNSN